MGLVFFLTRPLHFISRERISAHITFCRIPVLRKTSWVFFWPQFGITIHLGFCSWLITAPASLSVVLASCFLLLDARSSFVSRSSFSLISSHSLLLITCYKVFTRLLAARLLSITVACVVLFIARPISRFCALLILRVCCLLLTLLSTARYPLLGLNCLPSAARSRFSFFDSLILLLHSYFPQLAARYPLLASCSPLLPVQYPLPVLYYHTLADPCYSLCFAHILLFTLLYPRLVACFSQFPLLCQLSSTWRSLIPAQFSYS